MSFDKFLTKLFGSSNQRFLKTIAPLVQEINSLEPSVKALSDDELRARTAIFKERVQRAVADVTDKEERKRRRVLEEIVCLFRSQYVQVPVRDQVPERRAEDRKIIGEGEHSPLDGGYEGRQDVDQQEHALIRRHSFQSGKIEAS